MRFTVRVLGTEVFHVDTERDEQQQERGDSTSYPVGFSASHGDQRYEQGADL